MPTVNWLWFGNGPQNNSTPTSPSSQSEANSMVGYHAEGRDEIVPVAVTGNTYSTGNTQAFTTTFSTNGNRDVPNSQMTYLSPNTGTQVTSEITGFLSVRYTVTEGNGTVTTQNGVMIQMANGDMFFRPSQQALSEWDDVTSLRSVTIVNATPQPASTWVATVSFSREIFDMPVVCFAAGTMILTDRGERAVEDLIPGDLIWTRDHGFQPLRWCGVRRLDSVELNNNPHFLPIRIEAGALGADLPAQTLTVSPQHRVLVRSTIAQRMFGTSELLVAARQLTALPGITVQSDLPELTYVHLMFDRHEVILSNGAETESLYPGPQALKALGTAAVEEIFALFPELRDLGEEFPGARPFAAGHRVRRLAERHQANNRPLVS